MTARNCDGCNEDDWHGQSEPLLADTREQVLDPQTAYQIVSLLEGVVQRGTGRSVLAVGKPLAGKTGTSNESKDVWFVGFSPDLACGVYVGFDNPRTLGRNRAGRHGRRADLPRFHEGRALRTAGYSVPRRAGRRNRVGRLSQRRAFERCGIDQGDLQAEHRAGRAGRAEQRHRRRNGATAAPHHRSGARRPATTADPSNGGLY